MFLGHLHSLSGFPKDDQLVQMLEEIQEGNTDSEVESEEGEEREDQSRDIDLMASDDEEDEEEIESENEEDRAFLDDATEGQEDMSFYRRIHVDLDRDTRQEQRQQRLVWTRTNQWQQSPLSTGRKIEHLYTRTASVAFQSWEVRSECHQRIPVPVPNQASSYQIYCEKKQ